MENAEVKQEQIRETGSLDLEQGEGKHKIRLLTIIGEIEGHESVAGSTKATKYEHLLPMLAEIEDSSLSKPTVSLVLGGSHSIGGPLAVAAKYSFIVPSGTMIIHPVRSNGMFIGVEQSLRNMIRTQDRITRFLAAHSRISQRRLEELMLNPTELVKDVGTLLEGRDAVREGLIDEVGGMSDALLKLHEMIRLERQKKYKNM